MNNKYKLGLNTDKILLELKESINFWTKTIQPFCQDRVRKIRTVDIFEFVLQLAKNRSEGAQTILNMMYSEKNMLSKKVLKSSMSEARDKVVVNMWNQVIHDISKSLRKNIKSRRYFAIDGTVIALQNADFDGDYKKKNSSYVPHGYGSVLYDIDYQFPIDVILEGHCDERSLAIRHLDHLEKGDVVIMDRGYYSKKLFSEFTRKGVHVVFRMKSNTSKEEWKDDSNDIITSKDSIDCRFVKYNVNNTKYMLLTSLLDKTENTSEFVQMLYKKRWSIETQYGYVKNTCSLANLHARTVDHLQEEFSANFLLYSISRLLEYHSINKSSYDVVGGEFNRNVLINNNVRGKHNLKVNFKNCISLVNKYLHKILSDDIENIFEDLLEYIMIGLVGIRENRKFPRISITPINRWNLQRSANLRDSK